MHVILLLVVWHFTVSYLSEKASDSGVPPFSWASSPTLPFTKAVIKCSVDP